MRTQRRAGRPAPYDGDGGADDGAGAGDGGEVVAEEDGAGGGDVVDIVAVGLAGTVLAGVDAEEFAGEVASVGVVGDEIEGGGGEG